MAAFVYIAGPTSGSQVYTSGSGSFTIPPYATSIVFKLWGAGSGGFWESSNVTYAPTSGGGNTTVTIPSLSVTITAGGALAGDTVIEHGVGGTASGGDINTSGSNGITSQGNGGNAGNPTSPNPSGAGGAVITGNANGNLGNAYGGGGGGASNVYSGNTYAGGGGGGGAFAQKTYTFGGLSPGATINWSVGSGGPGGAGSGGYTGGVGANGGIVISWS
jgi:hypothetical protein